MAVPKHIHNVNDVPHNHNSGSGPQVDHGALGGLADNDHLQYVLKSLYDAHSILIAVSDDTPEVLVVPASRIVGRKATGNIGALTGAEILAILSAQAGAAFDWNNKNLINLASLITDTGTPRDLPIDCGANKTILLNQVVYEDLQFPVATGKVPAANAPSWEAFTTNTNEFAFSVDDYLDLQGGEVPHWWKEATIGDVHLHLTLKAANDTGADRFAKLTVYIATSDAGDVWAETSLTAELTIPTGSAANKAFYLDLGNLDLSAYLIGAQVKIRIKRIAATGGTEYASDTFITQVGIHLQKDTLGSRQEIVK